MKTLRIAFLLLLLVLQPFSAFTNTTMIVAYNTDSSDTAYTETTFTFIEEVAEFPGGKDAMFKFITLNFNFPSKAQQQGIDGKVSVEFFINEDGSVEQIKVIEGNGSGYDDELIEVLEKMPPWKPANQAGHIIRSKQFISIQFNI